MNAPYIIPIVLVIIVLLMQDRTKKIALYRVMKNKKAKNHTEVNEMIELAKRFVNKDCIVYTYNGAQIMGVIEDVGQTGIMLRTEGDGTAQLINADFILRIREHPLNKKGKKKGIILD